MLDALAEALDRLRPAAGRRAAQAHQEQVGAQEGMGARELAADALDAGARRQARLRANDQQVEEIGKAAAALLQHGLLPAAQRQARQQTTRAPRDGRQPSENAARGAPARTYDRQREAASSLQHAERASGRRSTRTPHPCRNSRRGSGLPQSLTRRAASSPTGPSPPSTADRRHRAPVAGPSAGPGVRPRCRGRVERDGAPPHGLPPLR